MARNGNALVEENEQWRCEPVELHIVRQIPRPADALLVEVVQIVDVERVLPPASDVCSPVTSLLILTIVLDIG